MDRRKNIVVPVMLVVFVIVQSLFLSVAQTTPTPSGYIDLQSTEIRGISAEDIEGYRTGAGLGYALPAELNGYPGPRHVLDLADDLNLSETQYGEIQALYEAMLPDAIKLGESILNEEAALEVSFRDGTITEDYLGAQLTTIEGLRADLRYVHLSTHLATINILTTHQVRQYNQLRGYDDTQPHDMEGHQ
ncbi:MAG: hypothetical protein KC708_25385 [Anaerolineae bacterium]|nr:hypothetical protein [Anaerolineae bacterium]